MSLHQCSIRQLFCYFAAASGLCVYVCITQYFSTDYTYRKTSKEDHSTAMEMGYWAKSTLWLDILDGLFILSNY